MKPKPSYEVLKRHTPVGKSDPGRLNVTFKIIATDYPSVSILT